MLEVKDAVAVITGGASGIGLALAQCWLEQGGRVVIADVSNDSLHAAEATLQQNASFNGQYALVTCNVCSEEDTARLAKIAMDTFGAINFVAPFAGIIKDSMLVDIDRSTGKVKKEMQLKDFQSVVDVNLTGVFLTVRACLKQMIDNSCKGSICLVSSTGSLGTAGQLNYSATKAAMSIWPKVITGELFRRGLSEAVRCNAVAPGYVATNMVVGMNQKALDKILDNVPIKRLIEPREIASLAIETYRNEALAGEVFFIHGGLRLSSKG